jgi:hypothetical protein
MALDGSATLFSKAYNSKIPEVQKIGKTYLFHGKILLNLCLGLCTPQKSQFMPILCPEQSIAEKCGLKA